MTPLLARILKHRISLLETGSMSTQCDSDARQARCIPTFPLLQAREYPDHRPLICGARKDWQVWVHNKREETKVLASKHAKALTLAAQANMPNWNNFLDHQAALSLRNTRMHDPEQLTSSILSMSTRATCRLDSSMPLWLQPESQSLVASKGGLQGIIQS